VAIGSYLCLCVSMHEPHVKRLKAGHEEAANELGDMNLAEDAVQERLLSVVTRIHQFRGESTLYSWMYTS